MAGLVKRMYDCDMRTFQKKITRPLCLIASVLPIEYDKSTVLSWFKKFYPSLWDEIIQRHELYNGKDKHLQSVGKKKRYNHDSPELFFFNLSKVKHMLSAGQRKKHKEEFDQSKFNLAFEDFSQERHKKIKNYYDKINGAKKLIQIVEPLYMDIFIAEYHKIGATMRDKIEIINELKRYEGPGLTEFFQKINYSEKNNQIRQMAFEHLQKTGKFVKLRKNFKGKTKQYMVERDAFDVVPEDLYERIRNNTVQCKKFYDVFVSHSYLDSSIVISIKNELNRKNINVYCDWTSDNDFLRRESFSEYTKMVLKKRIEQSNAVLFIKTENSMDCNYNISGQY